MKNELQQLDAVLIVLKVLDFFLLVAILLLGPIVSIWAINGLVGTEIPVNFKTWICSFWLFSGPLLFSKQAGKK